MLHDTYIDRSIDRLIDKKRERLQRRELNKILQNKLRQLVGKNRYYTN